MKITDPLVWPGAKIEVIESPAISEQFEYVRDQLLKTARLAGYSLIELPVFEDTEVFTRGVGESTDVVSKEMYTFEDRGGREQKLR